MALETTATFIGHNECFGLWNKEKYKNAVNLLLTEIICRHLKVKKVFHLLR